MTYVRPRPSSKLTKPQRARLLLEYYDEYRRLAKRDPSILNRKAPRQAFESLIDEIGQFLLLRAAAMARERSAVRQFLDDNPLPQSLQGRLPDDFRAFCLALNALKQWVSAEQLATDRFLLGALARKECLAAARACMVSSMTLVAGETELHHPVRDGRPPVPIAKKAHARIEGQAQSADGDPLRETLLQI
jgi:hypothetical protein